MSWMDLALVAGAVVALAAGLYTGFLRLVLAAAGLVAGLWVAWRYAAVLASNFAAALGSQRAAHALSFVVLVAATVGIAALVTLLLSRTLSIFRLGWADRTAGGLLALTGLLALASVFALSVGVEGAAGASLGGSRLLPVLARESRLLGERLGLSLTPRHTIPARPVEAEASATPGAAR